MSIIAALADHYKKNTIFYPHDQKASEFVITSITSRINDDALGQVFGEGNFRPLYPHLGFKNIVEYAMYSYHPFSIKLIIELLIHDFKLLNFFQKDDQCYANLVNFLSLEEEKKLFDWHLSYKEHISNIAKNYYSLGKRECWRDQQILFLSYLRKLFPEFFPLSFKIPDFQIGPGWFGLIEKYCYKLSCFRRAALVKDGHYFLRVKASNYDSSFSVIGHGGAFSNDFSAFSLELVNASKKICEGCCLFVEKVKGTTVCKNCL